MADGPRGRTAHVATGHASSPAIPVRSSRAASVEVGALRIALPGRDAAFGRRVAERVAATLAERCPPGLSGNLGGLQVKVHARDMSEAGLGEDIAQAVLAALGRF